MKLLLVISFIIPLTYIWYLISKLGDFLESKEIQAAAPVEQASSIVLGDTILVEKTTRLLERKGIRVICLTDPFQLIQEKELCYLFALSNSDADNIAFCKIGKKLYCIKKSFGICNDRKNENMFISEKINYLLVEETSPEKLILMVQPEVECEHKYE